MAPRQLVILRHAEKPDDPRDPDLSPGPMPPHPDFTVGELH